MKRRTGEASRQAASALFVAVQHAFVRSGGRLGIMVGRMESIPSCRSLPPGRAAGRGAAARCTHAQAAAVPRDGRHVTDRSSRHPSGLARET